MDRKEERTIEQKRAAHALEFVTGLKDGKYGNYGKFRSYVNGLPATIVMNGLGQAMATELAAANLGKAEQKRKTDHKAHEKLFKQIEKWLLLECDIYPESSDLMVAITFHGQDEYIRAQAEALAYLVWLKKFSQAYLKGDD